MPFKNKRMFTNLILFGSLAVIIIINALVYGVLAFFSMNSLPYLIATTILFIIIYLTGYIYIINSQISEINQKKSQTHLIENLLKGVIEGATESIAALDSDSKFIIFNNSYKNDFKKLFGKTIAIGMTLQEALENAPDYKVKKLNSWKRALAGEHFVEILEFGAETYEILSSPILAEDNQIIGAIHVNRNITRRTEQDKAISQLNEKLAYEMQELGIHNEKMVLLIELSDIMQTCANVQEATKAIAAKCARILHFADGALYIVNNTTKLLELAVTWGNPQPHEDLLKPDQCWALRKGNIYRVQNPKTDLICEHITEKNPTPYMCVPLMAHNTIFGLLHLDLSGIVTDENRILISAITETLSLALANINLRETLRDQSLHDSLTGLYNRRYLDEFLAKEINIAERNQTTLAVIMLDIDFFKKFNDKYGHEAGDMVLKELGKVMQNEVRSSDITCRYGGEEFICILPDCTLPEAKKFSEILRLKVADLALFFNKERLDHVTISLGIAMYPENGYTPAQLIEAADKAMYQAKKTNRNKVVAFSEMNHA